jgi:hypothetical protein
MNARHNRYSWGLVSLAFVIASIPNFGATPLREENVIKNIEEAEINRQIDLSGYSVIEHYVLRNGRFQTGAERTVSSTYINGHGTSYRTLSQSGSAALQRSVLDRLIQEQAAMSGGDTRQRSMITSMNYKIKFLREEPLNGRLCVVLELVPRTKSIYLLKGLAWFDSENLTLLRIEGRPTASPSFWAGRPMITREYQMIDGFLVAKESHAVADNFVLGKTELTIDYSDYRITK